MACSCSSVRSPVFSWVASMIPVMPDSSVWINSVFSACVNVISRRLIAISLLESIGIGVMGVQFVDIKLNTIRSGEEILKKC